MNLFGQGFSLKNNYMIILSDMQYLPTEDITHIEEEEPEQLPAGDSEIADE